MNTMYICCDIAFKKSQQNVSQKVRNNSSDNQIVICICKLWKLLCNGPNVGMDKGDLFVELPRIKNILASKEFQIHTHNTYSYTMDYFLPLWQLHVLISFLCFFLSLSPIIMLVFDMSCINVRQCSYVTNPRKISTCQTSIYS